MALRPPNLPLPKLPQMNVVPTYRSKHASFMPSKETQAAALKAAGQEKVDSYDLTMQTASILFSILNEEIKSGLKIISYGLQGVVDYSKGAEASRKTPASMKRNPLFGHDEANVPGEVTQAYLTTRRWKKMGSSGFQILGSVLSLVPVTVHTNIPGALLHGQATALTGVHMAKLGYIAAQRDTSQEVCDWIKLVQIAKGIKAATRGAQLAGSVIPTASMPTSIAAALIKAGMKINMAGACYAAAAAIHRLAYQEQRELQKTPYRTPVAFKTATGEGVPNFSRPFRGGVLPTLPPPPVLNAALINLRRGAATQVMAEIFTKRGATRILGAYDIAALIKEPAGWMALGEKLMLI